MMAQASLNLKKLAGLLKTGVTSENLRELGLERVPVAPDGALDQKLIERFIEAEQPADPFFDGHKVVTLAGWDDLRKRKLVELDPVSGEPLTLDDATAWRSGAPIRVRFGDPVPVADLYAYAAAKSLLPSGVNSHTVLDNLPLGTVPIEPSRSLRSAALEWPYDPDAPQIARERRQRRQSGGSVSLTRPAPAVVSVPVMAPAQQSGDLSPSRGMQMLATFLGEVYSTDELQRFVRWEVSSSIVDALPSGASRVATADHVAQAFVQNGYLGDNLRIKMVESRPRRRAEIDAIFEALQREGYWKRV